MKRLLKNPVLSFILGALMFGGIGTVLAYTVAANYVGYTPSNSSWNVSDVKGALDWLYSRAPGSSVCVRANTGSGISVGTKYVCNPGDGKYRFFYVLTVGSSTVDLIMDRNITENSIKCSDAEVYFTSGAGVSIANSWKNVQKVDIPSAQAIANAVGNTSWNVNTAKTTNAFFLDPKNGTFGNTQVANSSNPSAFYWLFENTANCEAYGCIWGAQSHQNNYWCKERVYNSTGNAWNVTREGKLNYKECINTTAGNNTAGVRPVITVSKSILN